MSAIKLSLILGVGFFGICITTLLGRPVMTAEASEANFSQRSGAAVYAQMCSRCHGADGRGNTPKGRSVGASDLTSGAWIPDTARDTRIVNRGKEGMPGFKSRLKPAEIDAVVGYIRRFKN
jgi:mono/diheme cytochrome c family protein